MKIGNKIKKIRELRGVAVKALAAKLNLSVNGYSKIERGEVDITLSKLEIIARALDVNIQLILDFDVDSFLKALSELKQQKKHIDDLKKENVKLWNLIQQRDKIKIPGSKTRGYKTI